MARFQPVEAFHPAEGSLELLPFRFERTERDYLLSNMVVNSSVFQAMS
jgi:hypothetical protein